MRKDPKLEKAIAYIKNLDLSYIVQKMTHEAYFLPRWTEKDALHGIQLYKNFLILSRKYRNQIFVPTKEIDEIWHNHILTTQQYHRDSEAIFGQYYHHDPSDPLDDETQKKLVVLFENTQAFYFKEFGEYL